MPSELGKFIRMKRTEAGLGLRELARKLEKSAPFLTQLELDDDPPPASEETLQAIAAALDIDPDELFARANKLPRDLTPGSSREVALYRKVKALPIDEQMKLLKRLEKEERSRED